MWMTNGNNITMVAGDFGISLPVNIEGLSLVSGSDTMRITIKDSSGSVVLTKEYSDFSENTFSFEIDESETEKLHVGAYIYGLDWYRNGVFMCNIIPKSTFVVVSKV